MPGKKKEGDVKDGQKTLKKLDPEKKWSVAKKVAATTFKNDIKSRKKDCDSKEEMKELAAEVDKFKEMNKRFKLGLSPTLKACANAKTPEEFSKRAKEAKKIVATYQKVVDQYYKVFKGGPKSPAYTLGGMLKRLDGDMNKLLKVFP